MSAAYNPDAVNRQIAADRRRHRITGREARLIHALLKGRTAPQEDRQP